MKAKCKKDHLDQFKTEVQFLRFNEKKALTGELMKKCDEELYTRMKSIPPRWTGIYGKIKQKFYSRGKCSVHQIAAIYLLAHYSKEELTHWHVEGNKLFRVAHPKEYLKGKQANIAQYKRKQKERNELNNDAGFVRRQENNAGKFMVYREKKNWY